MEVFIKKFQAIQHTWNRKSFVKCHFKASVPYYVMDFGMLHLQVGGQEGYLLKHEQKVACLRHLWVLFKCYSSQLNDEDGHLPNPMGKSLHYQVEHHMWTKFATPILHAIDKFKIYDNFFTYT